MSKVAVLKTKPKTVLEDYAKLLDLADYKKHIKKTKETVLKLNLSWSLYFPSCSTQPWQLDGVLKKMLSGKHKKIIPVENRTVVTDPWKGAKLNKWTPILEKYKLDFQPLTEVEWVSYKPKHEMLAMDHIFPGGFKIPKMFVGKNIVHLPTMKCVHPDTEIFLSDGSLVPIKKIVDDVHEQNKVMVTKDKDCVAFSNHDLPTLSEEGDIVASKATHFWKTPSPKKVFTIKTKTGREVIVSDVHPFLTPEGWKKAKELTRKTRIAIPRRIRIKGRSQALPKIASLGHKKIDITAIPFRKGKKHSVGIQKKIVNEYLNGRTTTEISKEMNIHYETIRNILMRYNVPVRWVKNRVSVPEKTSKEFWKWMGYFIAEGYAKDCNGTMRFWWSNNNKKIVNEYTALTNKLFRVKLKIKKRKGFVNSYYFDSNNMIPFFEKLGLSFPLVADTKKVPLLLFKCPDDEIAAFLQSYLDGDGTVAKDGLHATSKSRQLIKKIQLLLTRLGVVSFVNPSWNIATNSRMKKKEKYWKLSVYADELCALSCYVRLHSENKQENMKKLVEKRKKALKKPSNWDTIPVNPAVFRKVREGLGVTQETSGKPSSVNSIENHHALPTRNIMNYFIQLFEKKDKEKMFKNQTDYFKFLASEDIAWDCIEDIKKTDSDTSHLYDFSVTKTNNFIGNGVLLHNTHGHTMMTGAMKNAFGGLLTKRRHHSHKMIHEVLVDLLQIQKEIHTGIFAAMDGTVAGDGAGPRTMMPVIKNYILASGDQVAIDAVSAKMMGFDPMKIPFIKLAHDRGLGTGDPDQIEIAGDSISRTNFRFSSGKSPVIVWDQIFRKGKLKFLEQLLFHTALFKIPIFLSYFYHDVIWYNTTGKKRINEFMETPWGKLFREY